MAGEVLKGLTSVPGYVPMIIPGQHHGSDDIITKLETHMNTTARKRSNSVISHEVGGDGITFEVEGVGKLVLNIQSMHPDITRQAMFHGMIQRIRDAAAISRDTETGLAVDPKTKFDSMRELVEHYNSGSDSWNLSRSASGITGGERGLLIRVLKKAGAKVENVEEWVKAKSIGDVKAMLGSAKLKPLADELRSEGAAKVDCDEMLSGLGI